MSMALQMRCPVGLRSPTVRHRQGACVAHASRKGSDGTTPKAQAQADISGASGTGRVSWPKFLGSLFASGAIAGTVLDGIHSKEMLQIYKVLPVDIGGLHSALTVPPLLGLFYVVLGSLFVLLDERLPGPDTQKAQQRSADPPFMAFASGILAADLQLSAYLYSQGVPYTMISAALAVTAGLTWGFFDRTVQGVGLAALCAVGAPFAELIINSQIIELWYYPKADLDFGPLGSFVSWVPWCYFFYAPLLGTWARYLWQACRTEQVNE